jgi:16S rRNA (cytosine967-C5)-methyltransferase
LAKHTPTPTGRIAPARAAAFRALRVISSDNVDLGDALSRARDTLEDVRDRALATDLVVSTLRWRGAIDFQLQRCSTTPLGRLDGDVLDALRLGAYQLLYLARVPASAVVNDAVEIVRRAGFRSAAGFANAVLRRLGREREALIWPARPVGADGTADRAALLDHLSVVHSHPRWLVERWVARLGVVDAEAWLAFNNRAPALTLCVNRLRGTREHVAERLAAESVQTRLTATAPHGLIAPDARVLQSAAFREGWCVVQDEASQLIAEIVQAGAGARVLDACASPGGKTVALAAQAVGGIVVASDVRPRRVRLLAETLARCRVDTAYVVQVPERGALPFRDGAFDCVLVDAPCSGLGTLRRDPDIRWRRRPEHLQALASVQHDLLRRTAPLVSLGGRLVYSTCSSEPEENDDVIAAFLAESPGFARVPVSGIAGVPATVVSLSARDGVLRTSPLEGLEVFFGAVLERTTVVR